MTSCFGPQASPMMTQASNVGEGWHPLLRNLELGLNDLDPDFTLQQVKEKFGGLRYYAQSDADGFQELIGIAEEASTHLCEVCGKHGETKSFHGWLKTLCDEHFAEREARQNKEIEDLHITHGGEG